MVLFAASGTLLKQSGVCIYNIKHVCTFPHLYQHFLNWRLNQWPKAPVAQNIGCGRHMHKTDFWLGPHHAMCAKCFTQNADLLELFPGHLSRMLKLQHLSLTSDKTYLVHNQDLSGHQFVSRQVKCHQNQGSFLDNWSMNKLVFFLLQFRNSLLPGNGLTSDLSFFKQTYNQLCVCVFAGGGFVVVVVFVVVAVLCVCVLLLLGFCFWGVGRGYLLIFTINSMKGFFMSAFIVVFLQDRTVRWRFADSDWSLWYSEYLNWSNIELFIRSIVFRRMRKMHSSNKNDR